MAAYSFKYCRFASASSQYVTMGDTLGFERTDPFSFSFWFKCAVPGTYYCFITKVIASPYTGYQVTMDSSGYIGLWLENTDPGANRLYVRTTASYGVGGWRHCVITYNGSSLASGVVIYIDGSSVGKSTVYDTLTASILNTAAFRLAGRTDGSFYYNGDLDDVAVYSKVLSSVEVSWLYNSGDPNNMLDGGAPSNLVSWWKMGDGDTAPTLIDSGPGAHNGTMTNSPTILSKYFGGSLISYQEYVDGDIRSFPGIDTGRGYVESNVFKGRTSNPVNLGGSGIKVVFVKRARDLGSGPPPLYLTWTTTDRDSDPPSPPPIGPWGEMHVQDILFYE